MRGLPRIWSSGFTLIELIIYLALLGMLMAGAITAAYSLFESTGRSQTLLMLEQEGDFIMSKIDWVMSTAESVTEPVGYGPILWVQTTQGARIVSTSTTRIMLSVASAPAQPLTNANISVTHLGFMKTATTLLASTTLTARAPSGVVVSRSFRTAVPLP